MTRERQIATLLVHSAMKADGICLAKAKPSNIKHCIDRLAVEGDLPKLVEEYLFAELRVFNA